MNYLRIFLSVRNILVLTRSDNVYEGVSTSFRTGRLERELQMVQLSDTRCSRIAILWFSLVSFATITLYVTSQGVFIFVVYFVIDSVRKLLDTPSYFLRVLLPYSVPNLCKRWKCLVNQNITVLYCFLTKTVKPKIHFWVPFSNNEFLLLKPF
jgi:hypothetical protein